MTAALSHLTRSRTTGRRSVPIEPVHVAPQPRVADQGETHPDSDPNSSTPLLVLSGVWAALVGSGCLLAQPWRTGAFEMSITVATLFGLGAVLGLVLLVGFFQEIGSALVAAGDGQRVGWRYVRIGAAAALVTGTVLFVWFGVGTRIGFGRVQDRYDAAVQAHVDTPSASVRIAGVTYLVDADAREVRLEPTDVQMWGPPTLVWVRDGGRPSPTTTSSPTDLGGGWYME